MRRAPILGAAVVTGAGFFGSQLQAMAAGPGAVAASHPTGVLGFLANPTVAFVLLLIALLGVGLEFIHPGTFVFGSIGVVAGALAIAGLLNLSVDWLGLVLVASAVALLVVDTSGQSHGLISLAGVAAAVAGGLLLFRTSSEESGVNLVALVAVPLVAGGIWITLSRRALRVRHLPFGATTHELLGLTAVVRERADPQGSAAVEGELWRIVSLHGESIEVGTEVEVMAQDGLTLIVEPLPGPAPVSDSRTGPGVSAGVSTD
ncbi:MAG: NfeD family protein [Candidatus Dormiibacterota bacterium]